MHGSEPRGEALVARGPYREAGRFGRLYPELPALSSFAPGPAALGAVGGPMDGGNPPPNDTTQNNPRIKAGYTFLGQFIDHDLTLDVTSSLEQQVDPDAVENFRTPALELDSLYGLGPDVQPYLYDQHPDRRFRFLIGKDGIDLPRNPQGVALIGDPRNDENLIVSQLHRVFLQFHNQVFDTATDPAMGLRARFERTQQLVRWHYQWIVVNEFLPRLLGTKTAERIFRDRPLQFSGRPFMPVEFSVAAYRFGHSQVRPGYRMNDNAGAVLFPSILPANPAPPDLRGFQPLPPNLLIAWENFFGGAPAPAGQAGKKIDTLLSTVMLQLPDGVVPPGTPAERRSLAVRNLQRGIALKLPSGQCLAARMQICNPLTEAEIWSGVPGGAGPAPLWYYILKEAQVRAGGHRLAGLGAEIVGRVFQGLLDADPSSYRSQAPGWTPELPSATPGQFSMTDLIKIALPGTIIPPEDLASLPADD